MDKGWITVQLPFSEIEINPTLIEENFKKYLPKLEIFIPSLFYNDKNGQYTYSLFDGYLFVRGPYTDKDYRRLNNSPYVWKLLSYSNSTTYAYTPDTEIAKLKAKLSEMIPTDIVIGDNIDVIEGLYKDLKGKVVGETDESSFLVEIYMPLKSLTKLTTISKIFLKRDVNGKL